jgi:hypothetical protein
MPVHGPGVGTGEHSRFPDETRVASAFIGGRSVVTATAPTLLALVQRPSGLGFVRTHRLGPPGGGP